MVSVLQGCGPRMTLSLAGQTCANGHASAVLWSREGIGWGLCPQCYEREHAIRHYGRGCGRSVA